jgi:energy-coupling factor transport system permease protein
MRNQRLDPRTKLFLTLCGVILVMIVQRPQAISVVYGLTCIAVAGLGQIRSYLRWLRLVLPMALFFGAVTWWSTTWITGCSAGLKLLALATVFFIFFATTIPEDLGNALVKMGLPYTVAFVMTAALQFVPIIGRKSKTVLDAQRARGIPLEPGWSALRHYPAFLGPLLIQSFQLAEELAEAMEARGFGNPQRTFLNPCRLRKHDWLIMAGGLLLLAASIAWYYGYDRYL